MLCYECGTDTKVIDVRKFVDGTVLKRRRECLKCKRRFTTYEEEHKKKKQNIV
jgi:transcriptional repressor NrdR